MSEQVIDDKEGELRDLRDALERVKVEAESDRRDVEETKVELIRQNESTVNELELHLREYKELFDKQKMKFELARMQAIETLRKAFDKEREG